MKKFFIKKNIKRIIIIAVLALAVILLFYFNSNKYKYSDIFTNGYYISDEVKKIKIKKASENFYIDVITSLDIEKEQAENISKKMRNLALKDDNITKILKSYGKTKPVITVRIDVGDDGIFNYIYDGIYSEEVSTEHLGDKYVVWSFRDNVTGEQ